jgi:hippurate hydrolase
MSRTAPSPSALTPQEILDHCTRDFDRIVSLRRRIHRRPERGLANPETQSLILDELKAIGLTATKGKGKCTWVTADIRGTAAGPARCVLLRADMDALPLTETNETDYVSEVEGVMHACGHDGHVAMLLGAARVLYDNRERFAGTVRLMFQPGEEGAGGARVMIEEGALDNVDAAFAMHLQPSDPPNMMAWRDGPVLAADDSFFVTFAGAGGHASTPHDANDPIPAIGPFVDGLSHAAARETDPNDRVVFSVTRVQAGTGGNIIPHEVKCSGTIRSLSPTGRERAHAQLSRIAEGVAASHGLKVDVKLWMGYGPTINDRASVNRVVTAADALGLDLREMPGPYMGAEDFSYVLGKIPGAMVFLGCGTKDGGPLHSDRMQIDESVLPSGAALHVACALEFLAD